MVSVRFPIDLVAAAVTKAAKLDRSVSWIITQAVKHGLNNVK